MSGPVFAREFAMPNRDTFSVPPIREFVARYMKDSSVSVDPFARNARLATHTNDINPETDAEYHMDAEAFLALMHEQHVRADLGIFDPPYSPRQISECYRAAGLTVGMKETQNAALYRRVRDALDSIIVDGGVVLSFGWNSAGMGRARGYEIIEVLMVPHGAAHNDTICIAERKSALAASKAEAAERGNDLEGGDDERA